VGNGQPKRRGRQEVPLLLLGEGEGDEV